MGGHDGHSTSPAAPGAQYLALADLVLNGAADESAAARSQLWLTYSDPLLPEAEKSVIRHAIHHVNVREFIRRPIEEPISDAAKLGWLITSPPEDASDLAHHLWPVAGTMPDEIARWLERKVGE